MRTRLYVLWLAMTCSGLCGTAVAQTLPFGISLPPSLNFATSPGPVGSGARAVGKGTAFIAVADDATAASHNPAGLVHLERPEFSVVGAYFIRSERQDVTPPDTRVEGQTLDDLTLNYLSVSYPFELLQRNVVASLNVQRLFDLQGATDVVSRFTTVDGVQRVSSRQTGGLFTIAPALAVQITPAFSVGIALNIWPDIFDNGWDQDVSVRGSGFVASGTQAVPFTSQGSIRETFAFEGVNVTAGFLWTINTVFSLGGVVRTPFTARVDHTHTSSLNVTLQNAAPVTSGTHFSDTLDMHMPITYGLGLAARLSDRLTLSFDVSRTHWSDFRLERSTPQDVLEVQNGAPSGKGRTVLSGQGDDTTSVRLGAEYLWIRPVSTPWLAPRIIIPLRAGFFYDPEPGERGTDTFVGFSLGTGVGMKHCLFDIAYTFRTGTVQSSATDTRVHQHGFLTSIIYHF